MGRPQSKRGKNVNITLIGASDMFARGGALERRSALSPPPTFPAEIGGAGAALSVDPVAFDAGKCLE